MSMFGPTMCEFNNLKAEHDETRRRLDSLANLAKETSLLACELADRVSALENGEVKAVDIPASPTLTDQVADLTMEGPLLKRMACWIKTKQCHCTDIECARCRLLAEYNAARSAPAAQPHAVPADVLASIDLLEDDASAEPCNEHGRELNAAIKRVCRYVRKSASGAVAAGGGPPAAQPPTRKLNRAAFREWVKELKAGQARAAAERLTRMCKGEIEPYDYVSDAKLVNEAVIAWTEELIEPTPAASPPAGEILKQAANQIEWYRSLCQCLERGSLCQNCNDSTDIIDALRSVAPLPPPAGLPPCECCEGKGTGYYIGRKWVCGHCDGSGKAAPLPPPGEPGVYDAATCRALGDRIAKITKYAAIAILIRDLAGQPLPDVEGKP